MANNQNTGKVSYLLLILAFSILIGLIYIYHLLTNQKPEEIFVSLLPNLITAVLVYLLIHFLFIRKDISIQESISRELINTLKNNLPVVRNSGISNYYSKFPIAEFSQMIENSKEEVTIFLSWISDYHMIEENLVQASKRGVQVKILILDPDCEYAKQRTETLFDSPTNHIKLNLNEIAKSASKVGNKNFQFKVFNKNLSFGIFGIDDDYLIGWFWQKMHLRNKPILRISGRSSEMFLEIRYHFNDIWNNHSKNY